MIKVEMTKDNKIVSKRCPLEKDYCIKTKIIQGCLSTVDVCNHLKSVDIPNMLVKCKKEK